MIPFCNCYEQQKGNVILKGCRDYLTLTWLGIEPQHWGYGTQGMKKKQQIFSFFQNMGRRDEEKQTRLIFNKRLWTHVSKHIYSCKKKSWVPSFLDAEALWNFPLHPLILVKSLVFPVLEIKGNPASIKEKVEEMTKTLAWHYLISNYLQRLYLKCVNYC